MAAASRTKAQGPPQPARKPPRGSSKARPGAAKRSGLRGEAARNEGGLRSELIAAALELVEVSGTRGLSWREIARRARVSHSAPYRHFANKEELLAAVAEQGFRNLTERMLAQVNGAPDDVSKRLEAMAIAYVEFAAENPSHFRVMFGRDVPDISMHASLREAHDITDGLFREGVVQLLEEAGGTGTDVDVDHVALMAWSMVHGLASLTVDGRVGDVGKSAADPGEHVRSMTSLAKTLIQKLRS